jgi:hypothetical protein
MGSRRSITDSGVLYGIKVAACPFCGNSRQFCVFGPECEGMVDQYCVQCQSCFADGPRVRTKKGSVHAWNSTLSAAIEAARKGM